MGEPPEELPLSTLFGQLLTDSHALVMAEVDVLRRTVQFKLAAAKRALIFLAVALILVIAAITALLIGLSLSLAHWLGYALAGLVVAVIALAIAALLARFAARGLTAAAVAKPEEPLP